MALSNGFAVGLGGVWSAAASTMPESYRAALPAMTYLATVGRTKQNGRPAPKGIGFTRRRRLSPAFQSCASGLACLRNNWSPDANSLSVSYHGAVPFLELTMRGRAVLTGGWSLDVRVDGTPVALTGSWSCACWYSDDEGDYLELEAPAANGVRVERQMSLARKDDILVLADAVIAGPGRQIDYTSRLAAAGGVSMSVESPTGECRLRGPGIRGRAFPLGCRCKTGRGEDPGGGLSNRVELVHSAKGAVFVPLVLDWNPRRRRAAAECRPLTVAQDGTVLPADQAAAYRLRVGTAQWLVYRSLSRVQSPRTVLGEHTMQETIIGRFANGDLEPIILVEQKAD